MSFFTAEELEHVPGFIIARHGAGDVMFAKGDAGESMMLIAAGRVDGPASGPG